jgi:hypothetical protein
MKHFNKFLKILGNLSRLRNIFILIILTRLLFLEPNQLALIAEIIGGVATIMTTLANDTDDELL